MAIPVVVAFALNSHLGLAYALLPLLGFVLYAPFSPLIVLGQQYLAKNIGFASGVTLGLATTLGGVIVPFLGWIADNYGLPATFQFLSSLALLASLVAWTLTKPEHSMQKTEI